MPRNETDRKKTTLTLKKNIKQLGEMKKQTKRFENGQKVK